MKPITIFLHITVLLLLILVSCQNKPDLTVKKTREKGIEDFLLHQLYLHKILVIPECLSHDSYDAIRLPLNLIKRWTKDNHGIRRLFVGLEAEANSEEFRIIQNNSYYRHKRFATFCPPGWALFSTKRLNEYLFYQEITRKYPERFKVFGFENSFLYYDSTNSQYLLPSQVDTIEGLQTVPFTEAEAPFIIKYIYSRFFRDYRSYATIRKMIQDNPDAYFIIIIGNAHTSKEFYFEESDIDSQIIDVYKIAKEKYWHTVGYFLKQDHDPLFIQSNIDSSISRATLFTFDPAGPDTIRYKFFKAFYSDYIYSIPGGSGVNVEEQPLVCVPSMTNFNLFTSKNFQVYPDGEYIEFLKKLIYFMTGIFPEIKLDEPGKTGSCTFIDPQTDTAFAFDRFAVLIPDWYLDGTFVKRLNEYVRTYNHRSLFKAIFQLMEKTDSSPLSEEQGKIFMNHLLALLSVIGSEEEQTFARLHLSRQFGSSGDYYHYYKKFYYAKYSAD